MRRALLVSIMIAATALTYIGCDNTKDDGDATCSQACALIDDLSCANGPSLATCESDCSTDLAGSCASDYQSWLNCAVDANLSCDASDIPVVAGCDSEETAFRNCIGR